MFSDALWLWSAGAIAAWVFLGLAAGRFHAARNGLVDAHRSPRRGG